ncbi:MAG: lytic murein transglycosylase [Burkholderiaceae bacterium]|jgi:lytic murein transglycosylase|nr:lytic murein transglycosylase [Burkholderiales bacterium]MCZ8101305.1 lytic murein transglycosylase [Burkholderiales bacterium]MCZ8339271.1 lytic murein transglycosylase [Burkholderiaceae bacterium]
MPVSRRLAAIAASLATVAATTATAQPSTPAPPPSTSTSAAAAPAAPNPPAFDACLARLRSDAVARGVPAAAAERHLGAVERDPAVLESLDFQPEFRTPIWDYLAGLVDAQRVDDGRAMLERWRDALAAVEARHGVEPATVVAVWGVESDFGRSLGRKGIVRSLATLSCEGRRQAFFRGELMAALRILVDGHVAPERFTGSWAGAFGQTQFMPTTFLEAAVDFDGDGRRDIVDTVPDALASTANYLRRAGWRSGEPWGWEVRLPPGFDASLAGRTKRRPLADWAGRGVRRVDGRPLEPAGAVAGLILPAGASGPAFVVLRNFDAIYAYNAAESYALAIAHLADRLRGGEPFATPWPTDDPGLSRAERRELQTLLLARGHAIGEPDGLVGSLTRRAIRDEQARLGVAQDGRAGMKLLRALRAEAPAAPR